MTPAVRIALLFALVCCHGGVSMADDDPRQAIESLGGAVVAIGDLYEVDFHLQGRELTDDGLAHVANLETVVWLNLRGTKITDAGLVHLADLNSLRSLHLEETAVTDEGIGHLAKLPNLTYLNLYGTSVTDKALKQLEAAKKLRRLYVWRTDVTDEGVAQLAKALPELKITQGVELAALPADFAPEQAKPKPKVSLDWVAVANRSDAPPRSENGINCQVLFENKTKKPVKLYWIMYGGGELRPYGVIDAGATREQNTYANNAWLVTDENDQPLGYFVAKDDDALAVIPGEG